MTPDIATLARVDAEADAEVLPQGVRKKDLSRLELAASDIGVGYPGVQWEIAPTVYARLQRRGLVEAWVPDNPVHKCRAVITDAGRRVLRTLRAGSATP